MGTDYIENLTIKKHEYLVLDFLIFLENRNFFKNAKTQKKIVDGLKMGIKVVKIGLFG